MKEDQKLDAGKGTHTQLLKEKGLGPAAFMYGYNDKLAGVAPGCQKIPDSS